MGKRDYSSLNMPGLKGRRNTATFHSRYGTECCDWPWEKGEPFLSQLSSVAPSPFLPPPQDGLATQILTAPRVGADPPRDCFVPPDLLCYSLLKG